MEPSVSVQIVAHSRQGKEPCRGSQEGGAPDSAAATHRGGGSRAGPVPRKRREGD